MAIEHLWDVDRKLAQVQLMRTQNGDSKALDELEWGLIDLMPRAAMLPPETRVLKQNGRETRFNIDGKPCTMQEFLVHAKSKGIDAAKLEARIAQSAGKREQITTRSEVRAE